MSKDLQNGMSRRNFLKTGVFAAAGVMSAGLSYLPLFGTYCCSTIHFRMQCIIDSPRILCYTY